MNNARHEIPVVFASDERYLKYCSVAIQSLVRNQAENTIYHIYILCESIANSVKQKLNSVSFPNVTVEFIEVGGILDENLLFVDGHVTKETYYRILIPEVLEQWEKVIYLDVDLICNRDVADLIEVNLDGKLLAGVITVGNENRKDYALNYLGIPYETYINAGVLVIHNREIHKRFGGGEKFVETCCSYLRGKKRLKWHDQDLLNVLCYPDIVYLDHRWNTTPSRIMCEKNKRLEEIDRSDINESYIFHYATNKPWKNRLLALYIPFWESAYRSAFFDEIIKEYDSISDPKQHFIRLCGEGRISLLFILKCFYWAIISRIKR